MGDGRTGVDELPVKTGFSECGIENGDRVFVGLDVICALCFYFGVAQTVCDAF